MILRLTQKMKESVERLYRAPGGTDFVQRSTASALKRRGLAEYHGRIGPGPNQRTEAGEFPHYRMKLTGAGRAWCEAHYKKLAAADD